MPIHLEKSWLVTNHKTHPGPSEAPSLSFAGRGLLWREGADISAVVEIPPPQTAFCSLLTHISDQPHMHLQMILCHVTLGHKALFICFVPMQEAVSLEWKLISFTCLTFFTKLLSLTLELPSQEAQLGFELAALRSPNYVCDGATRNISSLKKVSVVTLLILFQGIQLNHKSLVTCLHHVFVMETHLPAVRWQNPADATSVLSELVTSKQTALLKGSLMSCRLTPPLLLSYQPPRNCDLMGRRRSKNPPTPDCYL